MYTVKIVLGEARAHQSTACKNGGHDPSNSPHGQPMVFIYSYFNRLFLLVNFYKNYKEL